MQYFNYPKATDNIDEIRMYLISIIDQLNNALTSIDESNFTERLRNEVNHIKQLSEDNKNTLLALPTNILNVVWPVGSIYIENDYSNPSSYLGGTWESLGSISIGQTSNWAWLRTE